MDIREQAIKNAAVAHQAAGTPSGCKACQRTGIPVFPLPAALRIKAIPLWINSYNVAQWKLK